MNTFKSRIGPELIVVMSLSLATSVIAFSSDPSWPPIIILAVVVAFIFHLFANTDYTISGEQLRVRSGILINKKIPISSINSISKTNSILSAPALSISGRILVCYNTNKSVVISPKEQDAFVQALLQINPKIKLAL